jgi:hypothetical protein
MTTFPVNTNSHAVLPHDYHNKSKDHSERSEESD